MTDHPVNPGWASSSRNNPAQFTVSGGNIGVILNEGLLGSKRAPKRTACEPNIYGCIKLFDMSQVEPSSRGSNVSMR